MFLYYLAQIEDYNYDESSGRGPSQWGNLKPDWVLCKKGKIQSPVDLTNVKVETVPDSEQVFAQHQPSFTRLVNRGHDIAVSYAIYLKYSNREIMYTSLQHYLGKKRRNY